MDMLRISKIVFYKWWTVLILCLLLSTMNVFEFLLIKRYLSELTNFFAY